jgi:hypothetical protein
MEKIHSYSKLYNIGHKAVEDLFNEEVLIQEKLDGSQISFCKTGDDIRAQSYIQKYQRRCSPKE